MADVRKEYAEGWHYINILDEFVKTGTLPDRDSLLNTDYLENYLYDVMGDPFVVYNVLSDDIKARVFYDNMLAFVKQIVAREKFRTACAQGQLQKMKHALLWSERKKRDGWRRLLSEIRDEFQEYGFDERYYSERFGNEGELADEEVWKNMIEDWTKAFDHKRMEQQRCDIEDIRSRHERNLRQNLENIPRYLQKNEVEKEMFFQAWGMMGGQWNTLIFEQHLRIAKIQKRYPQLERIANLMGRIPDDGGNRRMSVSHDGGLRLEHASRSDIHGVAFGNDMLSMLPFECAQCGDDALYDVFLYKYSRNCLQTFCHKSESLKPSRNLSCNPATSKGPMVVCVDRSGSMGGNPELLANSLMMKLLLIAERQKRDLFLVSFSVGARPIDARRDRTALLDFFRQVSAGDTSAVQMLDTLFSLLKSGTYVAADVLWCTDFIIPMCGEVQRRKLMEYRRQGTRFYGLKIGHAVDMGWKELFDEIIEV